MNECINVVIKKLEKGREYKPFSRLLRKLNPEPSCINISISFFLNNLSFRKDTG